LFARGAPGQEYLLSYLDLHSKDDLESICYILIDLFLQGEFLIGKSPHQYEEVKLSGKIENLGEGLPRVLGEFYYYVTSLNLSEEVNFFYWKSYLTKLLSTELLLQPYSFMHSKPSLDLGDFEGENEEWELDEGGEGENESILQKLQRCSLEGFAGKSHSVEN
jgi:hypothetical protein